ncbi:hypothetical protein VCHC62B1_1798, partial [Vibrio cholerae HC-62B1]
PKYTFALVGNFSQLL